MTEAPPETTAPKPASRWLTAFSDRPAILKELTILVLGILLAFGIDRAGEAWATDQQTRAVETALAEEVAVGLGHALELTTLETCRAEGLQALQAAVRAGEAPPARPRISARPWTDAVWRSALSSGAAEQLPRERLIAYSQLYGGFQALAQKQLAVRDNLLASDIARFPGVGVSERAQAATHMTIANADLTLSSRIAGQMLEIARDELGLEPTAEIRTWAESLIPDCGAPIANRTATPGVRP